MHYPIIQKTPLISARYWTVTIACGKYYMIYVSHLYTMELKCLNVNTSYSITEVFTCLITSKYVIEEYLQYSLTYTILTMNVIASQGLWQQLYCLGLSFQTLWVKKVRGENGQLEGFSSCPVSLNNSGVTWFNVSLLAFLTEAQSWVPNSM
jgi:hypothetical protein